MSVMPLSYYDMKMENTSNNDTTHLPGAINFVKTHLKQTKNDIDLTYSYPIFLNPIQPDTTKIKQNPSTIHRTHCANDIPYSTHKSNSKNIFFVLIHSVGMYSLQNVGHIITTVVVWWPIQKCVANLMATKKWITIKHLLEWHLSCDWSIFSEIGQGKYIAVLL